VSAKPRANGLIRSESELRSVPLRGRGNVCEPAPGESCEQVGEGNNGRDIRSEGMACLGGGLYLPIHRAANRNVSVYLGVWREFKRDV